MKKTFLMFAAAGMIAPALGQAQDAVTVYGVIDTSIDRIDAEGSATATQMVSNSSRLGFRGAENLGGGLKAFFGIEAGINTDTGAFSSAASQFRNSYVGLSGAFGALALGRLDSSNPTGSPLYSQRTKNIEAVIHDSGVAAFGTDVLNARNRVNNAIGYMSPTFGGFNMRARYWQTGPNNASTPGTGSGVIAEHHFRHLDVGFNYENGPFAAGIGFGKDAKRGGLLANDFDDKWQVVGSYDFKFVNAYGIYGQDSYRETATTRSNVDYWLVGASAPIGGAGSLIANYMRRDVQSDRNGELRKITVGYGHKLSKRTQLYAIVDREDPNSNVANNEIRAVSMGVQHKF